MIDWIKALSGFSQEAISAACERYIRQERSRRPTPADIREIIGGRREGSSIKQGGDKSRLSMDQRHMLETQILPTARRWLNVPDLADQAKSTLAYWGEETGRN